MNSQLARTIPFVLTGMWIAASTAPAEEKDKHLTARIKFTNGDLIIGSVVDSNDQHKLGIRSQQLKTVVPLKLESIQHIKFPHIKAPANLTANVTLYPRFRMREGDTIRGNLKEITDKHILLDTKTVGTLKIDRTYAQRIDRLYRGKGHYQGPNSAKEWTASPAESWSYTEGVFNSSSSGQIGRDLNLTNTSHIRFRVKHESVFRFKLRLYVDDIHDNTPDAYYEINLNRSYAYLQTRGTAQARAKVREKQGARWRQIIFDQSTKSHLVDVFTDRKTGAVTIFIDDKQVCTLNSQSPNPLNLGKGATFIAEERYPISISNIRVKPWNGILPEKPQAKKPDAKPKTPVLTEQKGKSIPFSTLKVQGEKIELISGRVSRVVPTSSWETIQLAANAQEPKKFSDDVKLLLHNGTKMIVRLDAFKNGKLHGYHQALGEINVELSAIQQIDFNVYAREPSAP